MTSTNTTTDLGSADVHEAGVDLLADAHDDGHVITHGPAGAVRAHDGVLAVGLQVGIVAGPQARRVVVAVVGGEVAGADHGLGCGGWWVLVWLGREG